MKILYFPMGSLNLGLPLSQVLKVIPHPTIFSSGQKPIGLAHFETQEVVVVDLHQYLFHQPSLTPPTHLVVVKVGTELYGLPCAGLPTLAEITPEHIRAIPPTYQQADTLGLASHVARLENDTMTLFLLDGKRLATLVTPSPTL